MRDLVQRKLNIADELAADRAEFGPVADAFHKAFYASRMTHGMTFYEGVPLLKNPLDLWVYQEILWDLRPTLLIETGTAYGGSALYYARTFDRVFGYDLESAEANRNGLVISIDIESAPMVPVHPRLQFVNKRSSLDPEVLATVGAIAATHPGVMVSLDSDHSKEHVLAELEAYAPLVTPGQFLVVEDTNLNGRPVDIDWKGGPGPGPAVDEWLPQHPEFERVQMAERYMVSFHTWLRRKPEGERS